MIFDDWFYPGNPARREEVASLRANITLNFNNFHNAWNELASILNDAFAQQKEGSAYSGVRLLLIEKSIEEDTVKDCMDEINNVVADARGKLNKLVEDIGLAGYLPEGWEDNGCTVNEIGAENVQRIGKILSAIGDAAVSAFVGFYVFRGALLATTILSVIAGATVGIGVTCASLLLGAVVGGVAFVLVDAIASAITGAIERKQLNEAIETLRALDAQVAPLSDASTKLSAIEQNIKDEIYKLDDTHVLVKKPDGSYVIIDMTAIALKGNWLLTAQSREEAEGILFLSA